MVKKKHRRSNFSHDDIQSLIERGEDWRTHVPVEVVEQVSFILEPLEMKVLAFHMDYPDWRTPPNQELALGLFGADRSDTFFQAPRLDWSIRLTEPDITRTIAILLNTGPATYRGQNIRAFLLALGVDADYLQGDIDGCHVEAERPVLKQSTGYDGRFDLWFQWRTDDAERIVVVEAKLDAHLTPAQLNDYQNSKDLKKAFKTDSLRLIVLGLHERVMDNVPLQKEQWTFCSWRDLLLRYERLRPEGARSTDLIYLNTLWHRVGALTQKAGNARI